MPAASQDHERLAGHVDETSVKVKGTRMSLYRAGDSKGNTLECLLSPTREMPSAQRFLGKTLGASHTSVPRDIPIDKNAAYPPALIKLKAAGTLADHCERRQMKKLNTLVEQDHRVLKRLVKPGVGFFACERARRTLQGDEVMNMRRKGQIQGRGQGDMDGQVAFIAGLFGRAA